MGVKPVAGLLCLALTAAAAWWFRDRLGLQQALMAAPEAPSASAADLRKCLADGRVVYTNGKCPAGSQVQALTGGSVSVVASPRPLLPPSAGTATLPNARELLLDPRGAAELKDRRMDAVIGK